MGLHLEAPFSFRSSAHDKVTRRDSPHASSFAPLHFLKTRLAKKRLLRQHSDSLNPSSAQKTSFGTMTEAVSSQDSNFFKLPLDLRQHIYSLLIPASCTTTLHILLKRALLTETTHLRFRACRADHAAELYCAHARCKAYRDATTGTYYGRFDSVLNLLLIDKTIHTEATDFLYSHYQFEFETAADVLRFFRMTGPEVKKTLRFLKFEPVYLLSTAINTSKHHRESKDLATYGQMWQKIDKLEGLERLVVRFKVNGAQSSELLVGQEFDPWSYFTPRKGRLIDVKVS